MANKYRAEATLWIGGKPVTVALTTSAVVELADALGVETFQELSSRLIEFKVRDVPIVIEALLTGNGYPVDREEIMANDANPHDYAQAISTLLAPPADRTASSSPPKPATQS